MRARRSKRIRTVAEVGEDRLVQDLVSGLPAPGPDVIAGPGDDCAVLRSGRRGFHRLFKADTLVEGIHFDADAPPSRVGWKALCRPASDVAAMGGRPGHALVTLVLPPETEAAWAHRLYRGIARASRELGIAVVGGETSGAPAGSPRVVDVSLLGEVEASRCVFRSGGRPGDLLFVTGKLGGSLAGKHLRFRPRIAEARWLVKNFRLHAMMDLSDGLGADLPRLCRASGTRFEVDPSKLPCSRGCDARAAVSDGEDYELLFAVAPQSRARLLAAWRDAFPKLPLTEIGRITPASSAPATLPGQADGFQHFQGQRGEAWDQRC